MIDGAYITGKLGIEESELEKYVELIPEAVSIAEGLVKRALNSKKRETFLDGSGCDQIVLPYYPVSDVVLNIDIERLFEAETEILPADYFVDNSTGILTLLDGIFPSKKCCIKVTYMSGYNPVPERLKEAILEIVKWLQSRLSNYGDGIGRRDVGADGISSTSEMVVPLHVKRILEGFQ